MARRVALATRDLLFRSKLGALVRACGGEVAPEVAACDLVVLELDAGDAAGRIRGLLARGIPVLAFGSHARADWLRAARDLGAEAVPNSQVERRLRELMDDRSRSAPANK